MECWSNGVIDERSGALAGAVFSFNSPFKSVSPSTFWKGIDADASI
jgi:hypothetical protein